MFHWSKCSIEEMFHWGNVPLRSCSIEEVFHWWYILLKKFQSWKCSTEENVPLRIGSIKGMFNNGNVPMRKMFHWGYVLLKKCSIVEMFYCGNVTLRKMFHWGKRSNEEMFHRWYVPLRKCSICDWSLVTWWGAIEAECGFICLLI